MRARSGARLAAVMGVLVLACVACSDDDDDGTPPGPTLLAGYSSVPPHLEGSWVLDSSIVTSTCGFLNEFFPTDPVLLQLTQVGNDIAFELRDACGRRLPSGTGRVTPEGIVTFTSRVFEPLTSSCTLRLTQVRSGTVAVPPNAITGSDGLAISEVGDCSPGVPCAVNGGFTATRCPESGCALTCND